MYSPGIDIWICTVALYLSMVSPFCYAESTSDPRRPSAIEVENVPVIPAELFLRLRQYQSVRQAQFRGWSPDGNGVLIQTQFANTAQLHRVYSPGGRREQITFNDEPTDGRFVPKRVDGVLTTQSQGGNENDQLIWQTFLDGRMELLTDGKSKHLLGPISHDGRFITVTSNRRNGRDMDLMLKDLKTPGEWKELMQVTNQTWVPLCFSPDAQQLVVNRDVSINETYPAIFDRATQKLRMLPAAPGASGKSAVNSACFSPDGKSLYLTSDAKSEFQTLAKVTWDDSNVVYDWLTEDIPWDVEHVECDPTTGRLAFTVNENGTSSLYLIGREGDKLLAPKQVAVPSGIIHNLKFSPTGDAVGFTLARPDSPSDVYSISLSDGELTRWTFSEVGGLNSESFIAPDLIHFPTFDNRKIPAFYFRTPAARSGKKTPVLIVIHGGPESQYRPLFNGTDQFFLQELGISVICPNVRGSSGYGKSYLQLDNAEKREDSVKDIGSLLDWIAQQPELDSTRVAVMGGSYGGYMVLASLTNHGARIKAGIDIVGISNFITFLENTSDYRKDLRRVEYGDERDPAMRAVFDRISPSRNAHKIQSKLLIAHGKNDPRVPFSEARQIAPLVRANGQEVWTVYAENEGHGFRKKDNRDYFSAVVAQFLINSLQSP